MCVCVLIIPHPYRQAAQRLQREGGLSHREGARDTRSASRGAPSLEFAARQVHLYKWLCIYICIYIGLTRYICIYSLCIRYICVYMCMDIWIFGYVYCETHGVCIVFSMTRALPLAVRHRSSSPPAR